MTRLSSRAALAAAILPLLFTAAFAQAEHEQHHPQAVPAPGTTAQPAPADKSASPSEMPKGGMMGGGMMGNMMQGGGMMGMMQGCPMMGMMMGTGGGVETRVKGRIAFLKAELAITDSQKGAWDAYAAALEKNLEGMQSARKIVMKMMDAQSPVERLDAHIRVMESRIATLKEIKPVMADLYASLSDEQKKTAIQLLGGMGCMM